LPTPARTLSVAHDPTNDDDPKPSLWRRLLRRRDKADDDEIPLGEGPNEDILPPIASVEIVEPIGMAAAVRPDASVPPAHPVLARVQQLRSDGRIDQAIFEVEHALGDDPDNVALHDELHRLYSRAGDPYATLAHGQRWLRALVRAGLLREALAGLHRLHAIDEDFTLDDGDSIPPLAALAMHDGARDLAVSLVNGFDSRFPGHKDLPQMYYLGARLLSEHWHQHDKAAHMMRTVVAQYADHSVAEDARAYLVALQARIDAENT
jgi:hypothetical protein